MRRPEADSIRALSDALARELDPLLAAIGAIELDGWDTDWVQRAKHSAAALQAALETQLPWVALQPLVEALGVELTLHQWLGTTRAAPEWEAIVRGVLAALEQLRRAARAQDPGGPAA